MDRQSIEKVVLIGSGNVATQLAGVFIQKGLKITQVYSRSLAHAEKLAKMAGCETTNLINSIRKDADMYVIAVKDDAISEINKSLRLPGKMVVHTSGTVDLASIHDISEKRGAFYPLQTITKNRDLNWESIPFILEASDNETLDSLKYIANKISHSVYEIDSENRKRLHVAAVFANNFINYLLGEAKTILGGTIPFQILEPLVKETVEKAFSMGAKASQTGPAKRQDLKTIDMHLELLHNLPEAGYIYKVISQSIIKKYTKKDD